MTKKTTIDDLAGMVQRGFKGVDKRLGAVIPPCRDQTAGLTKELLATPAYLLIKSPHEEPTEKDE